MFHGSAPPETMLLVTSLYDCQSLTACRQSTGPRGKRSERSHVQKLAVATITKDGEREGKEGMRFRRKHRKSPVEEWHDRCPDRIVMATGRSRGSSIKRVRNDAAKW